MRSFSVRKEAKDHGVTGRIAGALEPGDHVVITEDTVTRGTSLMEAVDVVREFGAEPVLITVIVDRGGTCAALAEPPASPTARCSPPPTSASRPVPDQAASGPIGRRTSVCRARPTGPRSSNSRASARPMPSGSQ